ncbi:polysaccharide deacetylase family protein [Paenibacillus yanchengensis]|uniref:Polysaccharide deacetylase family protein n=1 Tax=Paenibacillus yanchengensis TaxID=2035833 RepID=A0ABW4YQF2_9BACL
MNLAERLGYDVDAKLLLVNGDDYGLCNAVNSAVQSLLEQEAISSATIMMPCGWAPQAALWSAQHPQYDVGIHLTFTSEWDHYKWGPVTTTGSTDSLVTPMGYFPKTCEAFETDATEAQVRIEIVSQIERALQLGMKPTHADNHMGSLYGLATGRTFLPLVLEICATYGLPFRMPRYVLEQDGQIAGIEHAEQAAQIAEVADKLGVIIPDYLIGLPFHKQVGETYDSWKQQLMQVLRYLHSGVSELIIHPAYDTEELQAFHFEPEKRSWEYHIFLDEEVQQTLKQQNIHLIRWRQLQQLQQGNSSK